MIGSALYRTITTENSMAWAKQHMHDAPDGAIFLANTLSKAYGRQGRSWSVYPGQLAVTILLKPAILATLSTEDLPIRLNQLTMALSIGLITPLKQYGAELKWPNDLVIQHKKIGGILMHTVWENQHPSGIIVGFALNINNVFQPDDALYKTAISLIMTSGHEVAMRPLYKEIIAHMDAWYTQWQENHFMRIYKLWKEHQAYIGKNLQIHEKDGTIQTGIAHQLMPNGDLVLLDTKHKQKIIPFYQVEAVRYEETELS